MNKVYVMGYVKELEVKKDKRGVDEATFKIKTKKTVGMKGNDWNEYYYIPCFIRGKKAKDMGNNLIDEQKISIWGRIKLDEFRRLSLVVDEIEFL